MDNLVLEKKIKKYCLATIQDNVCWYLRSLHQIGAWEMVTDIEAASKAATKAVANLLRENYERDMGKNALHFVTVPVIIDYNLVKEVDDE